MSGQTVTNPRRLVSEASMQQLVGALASDRPAAVIDLNDDGLYMFVCPRCGRYDFNGGSAQILDEYRFICHNLACRASGTRYWLERIILESSDALEALYESAN